MPSIADNGKKRGRPTTGIGKPVGLRLYGEMEDALEAFIADQRETVSRPEAIRLILAKFLRSKGYLPK